MNQVFASLELVLNQNKNLSILGSVILVIMLDIILERLQYNISRQVEHENEEVPENDDLVERTMKLILMMNLKILKKISTKITNLGFK
jgi:nitric oxide reductase large subunit